MDEFKKEVKELSTADLLLILEDQVDLYSDEELKILRDEFASRPENALELEAEEQARKEKNRRKNGTTSRDRTANPTAETSL